eukprot:TRINITY_DN19090_c0_g1_i1.p1 TRINITY_DN19090_c0_g1~~TRINITY_DN19090_c0_g1_i1.p1  ORF type:complete len:636 (+),score=149.29 TRINITY_DN19090_c0_g1_i1:72-1979(+)
MNPEWYWLLQQQGQIPGYGQPVMPTPTMQPIQNAKGKGAKGQAAKGAKGGRGKKATQQPTDDFGFSGRRNGSQREQHQPQQQQQHHYNQHQHQHHEKGTYAHENNTTTNPNEQPPLGIYIAGPGGAPEKTPPPPSERRYSSTTETREGDSPPSRGKKKNDENSDEKNHTSTIPKYPPSKIVLLRRVSWNATQGMLKDIGSEFGNVERVIMLRSKNHALIEFTRLEDAVKMVDFYKNHRDSVIVISSHQATIGYCKHQKWVAPSASKTLLASLFDSSARITECLYVSPRMIYQLFAPFGAIEAVIVLPKKAAKNRIQALVQFTTTEQAANVKDLMQGLPVWFGGKAQLALDLLFSKVESISCALLPGQTFIIPREVAEMHTKQIAKYGSLHEVYSKPVSELSFEELEDFCAWREVCTKHALQQQAELEPVFKRAADLTDEEYEVEDMFATVLAKHHSPIAEEWHVHKNITLEQQQATLQHMEMLIHNGGMAATSRLEFRDKNSDTSSNHEGVTNDNLLDVDQLSYLTDTRLGACSAPAVMSTHCMKAFTIPTDREIVVNPSLMAVSIDSQHAPLKGGTSLAGGTPLTGGNSLSDVIPSVFTAPHHYGLISGGCSPDFPPSDSQANAVSDEQATIMT